MVKYGPVVGLNMYEIGAEFGPWIPKKKIDKRAAIFGARSSSL